MACSASSLHGWRCTSTERRPRVQARSAHPRTSAAVALKALFRHRRPTTPTTPPARAPILTKVVCWHAGCHRRHPAAPTPPRVVWFAATSPRRLLVYLRANRRLRHRMALCLYLSPRVCVQSPATAAPCVIAPERRDSPVTVRQACGAPSRLSRVANPLSNTSPCQRRLECRCRHCSLDPMVRPFRRAEATVWLPRLPRGCKPLSHPRRRRQRHHAFPHHLWRPHSCHPGHSQTQAPQRGVLEGLLEGLVVARCSLVAAPPRLRQLPHRRWQNPRTYRFAPRVAQPCMV